MIPCYYRLSKALVCDHPRITTHGFPLNSSRASLWFCINCPHKSEAQPIKPKIFRASFIPNGKVVDSYSNLSDFEEDDTNENMQAM
jgi:hypothetical protein